MGSEGTLTFATSAHLPCLPNSSEVLNSVPLSTSPHRDQVRKSNPTSIIFMVGTASVDCCQTCCEIRYRALLAVVVAAATTWTVQEAWLTWRAGSDASCPAAAREQPLPELKQARLPPVSCEPPSTAPMCASKCSGPCGAQHRRGTAAWTPAGPALLTIRRNVGVNEALRFRSGSNTWMN